MSSRSPRDDRLGDAPTEPDQTEGTVQCSIDVPIDWAAALAATPAAQQAAPSPSGHDRYRDRGEIGHGGMGSVRRVFDEVLLREVACKSVLNPVRASRAGMEFVEEAQITGQLDHPNIVPVYDLGTQKDGHTYFTMKLVSGRTLSELIAELHRHGMPGDRLEAVLRILLKVCEAVAFAHSRGVVHRDLKPANIMVGSHGQVYVMDWGLGLLLAGSRPSRAHDPEAAHTPIATSSGSHGATLALAGTVAYMAPEQAAGRIDRIDTRTDIFALGAILYEVLTGRPPYAMQDPSEALALAREARIAPPQDVARVPLPPGLCEIAACALRRLPEERYTSVDALREALESFLRGGGWFATRRYEDGEAIVSEGEPSVEAFVLMDGQCAVEQLRDGRAVRLRTLQAGDVFGETGLVSDAPRTATVSAIGPATVKVVAADAFGRELERSPLLQAVVRQLTVRFLELERRVAELESGPTPK